MVIILAGQKENEEGKKGSFRCADECAPDEREADQVARGPLVSLGSQLPRVA
jgi:hypothetical protein